MKIHELYGQVPKTGDIGIEVEVEFAASQHPLPNDPGGSWVAVTDNSLRNGMEYRTRQPVKADSRLLSRIEHLTKYLSNYPVTISHRCSVHVHLNVQNHTMLEVMNFITIYWLIENILIKMCGPHRESNLFCLRLKDAPNIVSILMTFLEKKDYDITRFITTQNSKYGGINLSHIADFGSIEIRTMEGTVDPKRIYDWCMLLHHLAEVSKNFPDPEKIADLFLQAEKDIFLCSILPASYLDKLRNIEGYKKIARTNLDILAPFVYFDHDWKEWERRINTKSKPSIVANGSTLPDGYTFATTTANSWNPTPIDFTMNILEDL